MIFLTSQLRWWGPGERFGPQPAQESVRLLREDWVTEGCEIRRRVWRAGSGQLLWVTGQVKGNIWGRLFWPSYLCSAWDMHVKLMLLNFTHVFLKFADHTYSEISYCICCIHLVEPLPPFLIYYSFVLFILYSLADNRSSFPPLCSCKKSIAFWALKIITLAYYIFHLYGILK